MPLNDRQIRNAKPTEAGKKAKLFDGGGLYLEVTPAGGKIFRLKYRIDGKEKTLTIGKYPAVSLSEARQAAENARRLLSDGQDPSAAKQQAKALPAKKMKARYAGALNGAAVHLGTPDGQGRLLAAEGIETALAASAMFGLPAAACLSAHGLSAFGRPPETRELYIAADNDLSRTGIKAAEALAHRAHAAGITVKIWQPDKAGTDALDEWNTRKGRLKGEGAAQ